MGQLTINFTPATPTPIGYRVEYRKVGDSTYINYETSQLTSPIIVPNVDFTYPYEGHVKAKCSSTTYSDLTDNFIVYPPTIIVLREFYGAYHTGASEQNSGIGFYNPITGKSLPLWRDFMSMVGITRNKLFISNYVNNASPAFKEFDITLDPFSITLNRTLSISKNMTAFFAKNDTTIIGMGINNGTNTSIDGMIYQLDVSGSSIVYSELVQLQLPIGAYPSNGLFYNSIGDRYIAIFENGTGGQTIGQFRPDGSLEASVNYNKNNFGGGLAGLMHTIIPYQNKLYGITNPGKVFEIKLSGITLYSNPDDAKQLFGATQLQEYSNINIPA